MEESWSGLAPCSAASWPPTAWSMPPPSQREAAPQTRVRHASACPSIRGVPLVSVHARHRQLRMQHACTTGRPCEPISGGSGQGVAVGANPPIGLRRGSHSRPRDENLTAGARSRRARTHALACQEHAQLKQSNAARLCLDLLGAVVALYKARPGAFQLDIFNYSMKYCPSRTFRTRDRVATRGDFANFCTCSWASAAPLFVLLRPPSPPQPSSVDPTGPTGQGCNIAKCSERLAGFFIEGLVAEGVGDPGCQLRLPRAEPD